MIRRHLFALALVPALTLSACVTTTTRSTTWGDPYADQGWVRYGRVEYVREVVRRTEGNPAAGAAMGAIIGGVLGSALGGHTHYDAWGRAYHSGSAAGAVVGAVGGAAVGAAASQGSAEDRTYEVTIAYDDGGRETYVYGYAPFQPGQLVALTAQGLSVR